MTIDRKLGTFSFNCDQRGCRANFEADHETTDFRAAWAEAKAAGWVNTHGRFGWEHACPRCKKQLGDD
jgi:hypothetical protein